MMQPEEIQRILEGAIPGAKVSVRDLTGGLDHFQVEVISEVFKGKMLIDQHRMVQNPLKAAVADERIHALTIKTYTPEEWGKRNLIALEE